MLVQVKDVATFISDLNEGGDLLKAGSGTYRIRGINPSQMSGGPSQAGGAGYQGWGAGGPSQSAGGAFWGGPTQGGGQAGTQPFATGRPW